MKKFMVPGAAAVAAAALSLLLGGGVANAQEVVEAPAPLQLPAIHVMDAIDASIPDTPAPAVPASDVLSFLADSLNLVGRDVLHNTDAAGLPVANAMSKILGSQSVFRTEEAPVDDANAENPDNSLEALAMKAAPCWRSVAFRCLGFPVASLVLLLVR